jgi:T5orf172 domain
MADLSEDEELLAELGVEVKVEKTSTYTPLEERMIAGFEDIQRFVDEHKRPPRHGEGNDIFERIYAVRLDRIRELPEARMLLAAMDRQGLLDTNTASGFAEPEDDNALLAELGIPTAAPLQQDIKSGNREARRFEQDASIERGEFFILSGQFCLVANVGELFVNDYDRKDRRLRVIYDNGTEQDILLRSFQRALYKDEAGRRVTNPTAGPLFDGIANEEDSGSGLIYVLRSKSEHPTIAANRDLVHKIGVTTGKLEARIARANLEPTYLLADVEVVATYELFNIKASKLENLIHRFFHPARLDLEIRDRFGNPVRPEEWYLVPLAAIDKAVTLLRDGSISEFRYDVASATIAKLE